MNSNLSPETEQSVSNGSPPPTSIVISAEKQEQLLNLILEKGGELFLKYSTMKIEEQRDAVAKSIEVEKEELKVLNKLDTKEKIYKGILIALCVSAIVFSSWVLPNKAEVITPVITLIIGLLLKSNSLAYFNSHSKGKKEKNDSESE
ncbi:hypothetical protein ACTHGU_07045 [Chitinophagaceae bacterium MMS25-I14]